MSALLTSLLACSGSDTDNLTVFAASSLTDVLPDLAEAFEEQTGTTITAVFGGSNHLAAQLRDGAPADTFLTADARFLGTKGLTGQSISFATNHLVVAVPSGNPAGLASVADLARSELRVVVCAESVPCGAATSHMRIRIEADSREPSVRAVLSRLSLGEADVGIVYASDVLAVPQVEEAWPQPRACPCIAYVGVAITDSATPFIKFMGSSAAAEILSAHGFSTETSG